MTRVVKMTAAHVDQLMAYEREMFGTEAWSRGGYLDEIAERRTRYYVAIESDDGTLLGWGGVMIVQDTAEILTVGVVPTARRTGLARRMIAELLAEAEVRGAREAFLEVRVDNEPARELYRSEGFVEMGLRRGYYDGGRVDGVTMRKELSA